MGVAMPAGRRPPRKRARWRRECRRRGGGRCGSSKFSPRKSLREIDVGGLVGYETIAINYAVFFYSIQRFLAVWKEKLFDGNGSYSAYCFAASGVPPCGGSVPGLRSKKPAGTSDRLCHWVGITGQSSGRGTW